MLFITDWNHKLTVEVTKEAKTYAQNLYFSKFEQMFSIL